MTSAVLFFFNDTATTEIYTLSRHDALPISCAAASRSSASPPGSSSPPSRSTCSRRVPATPSSFVRSWTTEHPRSEEHTSELQSRQYLVCRLLLETKKNISTNVQPPYSHCAS